MSNLEMILSQLKRCADHPMASATAMPKQLYTSPEIAALEIERLFMRQWICAGRSDEIPHSGDYMSFDLCDQPLIIQRHADGVIHAMSNVCRHRMMRLVEGRGNAKGFTCPYHAWSYDQNGSLVAAPFMDKTACFDKSKLSLPTVRCEEYQGWIYVCIDPDIPPVHEMLADLSQLTDRYQMENYRTIFTENHVWDCNWKCLTDNFMESYHLPMAHQNTVGKHFVVDETSFEETATHPHFTYQLFTKSDGAFVGTAHAQNHHLEGKWRNISVMPTIFPAHMYVLAPDHVWYLCLQPLGKDKVSIKYGAALAPEVLAHSPNKAEQIAAVKAFLDEVQAEDKHVVEGIFKGAHAPLAQPGPLSWLEKENHDFTQYLARHLCR